MFMALSDGRTVNTNQIAYFGDYEITDVTRTMASHEGLNSTIYLVNGTQLHVPETVEELNDLFGLGIQGSAHALDQINSNLLRAFNDEDGMISSIAQSLDGIQRILTASHEAQHGSMS